MVGAGCGAIVALEGVVWPAWLAVLLISLACGVTIALVTRGLGPLSGAHINPAVTLGLWRAGRVLGRVVAPWISGQVLGAVAVASLLLPLADDGSALGPLDRRRGA